MVMIRLLSAALIGSLAIPPSPHPSVVYRVRVDPADTTGFAVVMTIRDAPRLLRLGIARHPEYDDRFWRCVEDLRVTSAGRELALQREDSAVWRGRLPAGEATVRYRIALPPLRPNSGGLRAAWQPAVSSTGALLGADAFLYLVDDTLAAAQVVLDLPADWIVASGLARSAERTLEAPTLAVLLDAPIMVGRLRIWDVPAHGPQTTIAYWPTGASVPFDSAALVRGIARIVTATSDLFGWRWPYVRYTFLLEDGALGALEHANSATIGVPGARLAADSTWPLMTIAHEYFHTWNLVRLRPAGWGGVTIGPPERTTGLWWSEGVTIYFARSLLRRAGFVSDSAARQQLVNLIGRWRANAGQATIAPERSSWTINDPPPPGAPRSDIWTQGEVIGNVLDAIIRDSTHTTRSLDDGMRAMVERFGGPAGFTSQELERTLGEVCGCDLHRFFEDHVRHAAPLDLTPFLERSGRPH